MTFFNSWTKSMCFSLVGLLYSVDLNWNRIIGNCYHEICNIIYSNVNHIFVGGCRKSSEDLAQGWLTSTSWEKDEEKKEEM